MIIYKATNKVNNKIYIGKTVNSLNDRILGHNSDARLNKFNSLFHAAIHKYGEDNFEWEILCETDSESKLNALEKFYIATYRKMARLYNILNGGDGSGSGENHYFYGKHHTEETKKKISESKKGNCKPNSGSFKKGQIISEETREKLKGRTPWNKGNGIYMSGEKNHFYGKKHSEETKRKISEKKKGNSPAWNKGLSPSIETRKKISNTLKGNIVPDEVRKKISKTLKGRKRSPETINKFVETMRKKREANHGL